MQHGYTSTTPAGLLIGAGLLYIGSGTHFGVSDGGFTFDPGKTWQNVGFDGKYSDIVGLDWITQYAPKMTGTLKEVSLVNLQRLEQNVVFNGATPNVLTPKAAGTLLVVSDYLQDVRLVIDVNGQFHRVRFPYALCTGYTIKSQDKSTATIDVTIEARLNPTGTPPDLTVAPYTHERATTTP